MGDRLLVGIEKGEFITDRNDVQRERETGIVRVRPEVIRITVDIAGIRLQSDPTAIPSTDRLDFTPLSIEQPFFVAVLKRLKFYFTKLYYI